MNMGAAAVGNYFVVKSVESCQQLSRSVESSVRLFSEVIVMNGSDIRVPGVALTTVLNIG